MSEGLYPEVLGQATSLDTQEACDRAARKWLKKGYLEETRAIHSHYVRAFQGRKAV